MNPTVQVERDANAIAIVGMACRLPGGAHTPDAFWDLLIQRTSTMQVVPASRFNIADYYVDPAVSGADRTNRMGTDKGHFLTEATCFDEGFFNMSPRQAINTDPQQRVLLETVVDALDDAGYRPADEGGETGWNRERIGMYAASAFVSYEHNMSTSIDAFFVPGVARGFISGRASHFFKWQGPAITYDAACAAGLVAVHAACQSLLMRETDAVVAGGTNIITSPEFFVGLNKGFFVSSTGGCRTFDETGDGYCRGEAVGVVVLKRLADALRDNDPIHALILSSAVNHSGLAPTLTAPHVPALAALFTQNCEKAGVRKEEVRAVEMHAPGTQAGDWAEVEAVRRAFGRAPIGADEQEGEVGEGVEQVGDEALYISSIKPNVGHAESSAGIASLIKATLMLRHRMATPHIGVKTRVNPRLGDLGASGMVIPIRATRLTPAGGAQRVIVSVNSFGAQGSNANALIAEYIPPAPSSSPSSASASSSASSAPAATTAAPANSASSTAHTRQPTDPRTHHIIALSAKPHTPLPLILSRFSAHLEANPTIELGSLSYTTTARRVGYPVRMAFSVSSLEELKTQLAGAGAAALDSTANATTGNKENAQNKEGGGKKRIGFLLGGNGAQFRGMGGQMYESSRVFRGAVDECRGALRAALHANADVPANAGSGEEKQDGEEVGMGESEEDDILLRAIRGTIDPLLHTFEAVLAATAGVIAIEYALGRVWAEEWGVRPDVVLGHSLGEYAGLVLAGVLSLRDVMTLVVAKCRAMFDAGLQPQDGTPHGMLALGCSTDIALSLARTAGVTGLEIACFNGPSQTVFAGPRPALEALLAHVRASPSPPPAKILPGSFAWHSSYVAPHAARVISSASSAGITPQPATTPMLLNLSGNVLEVGATVDAGYLGTQMQSAVRWDACVANPLCAGVDVWIELSPKAILIPLLRSSLPPFPSSPASRMFLPTLNGAVDAWKTVTSALARLYEAGVPVDWAGYHKEYPVRVVRLPTYPFARNEHYIPYVGRQAHQHPQAQAQAQEEQEGRERAMKEAMQEEREEKERKKRKVRVVFALGTLEVEEAGRRYGFEPAEGGMGVAQYLWLAMTCAGTTSVADLRVFQCEGEGGDPETRISVVILEGGAISFTSGSGALLASATIAGSASASGASTSQHLVRARKRLLADSTASSFASAVVARLLDERSGGAARAVVAAECDEAISTVELSSPPALHKAHAGIASPPLSPSDIVALLSSPRLLLLLAGKSTPLFALDSFRLYADWDAMHEVGVHSVFDAGSGAVEAYFFAGTRELGCASWVEYASVSASASPSREGASCAMSAVSSITRAPSTVPPFLPAPPFLRAVTAPAPLAPSPKAAIVAVSLHPAPAGAGFTQAALFTTLAQEMGVPSHTISMSSTLESLGVDSITSLLLRDRLAGKAPWIMWRSGLTVQDLWDHVNAKPASVAVSIPAASPPAPAAAGFTQAALFTTLAQEMGVPAHTISMSSTLESLGVDSITSLLLRDRLGGKKAWIMWRSGLTVQDLWDHVSAV